MLKLCTRLLSDLSTVRVELWIASAEADAVIGRVGSGLSTDTRLERKYVPSSSNSKFLAVIPSRLTFAPVGVAVKTADALSSSVPNLFVTKLPDFSFKIASFSDLKLGDALAVVVTPYVLCTLYENVLLDVEFVFVFETCCAIDGLPVFRLITMLAIISLSKVFIFSCL